MSERLLRNVFIIGSIFFFGLLVVMTVISLNQVTSARTATVTEQVAAGKKVFQAKNCNDCHTILGIGGYFAPDLTRVFDTRGSAWLRAWLKDPQTVEAGVSMPDQHLSDTQIEDMVFFLEWVSKTDTNNWPPQPLNGVSATSGDQATIGKSLFESKGCSSCHAIQGKGSTYGPDLTKISQQRDTAWLKSWLADPHAVKPGSTMPNPRLINTEIDSLVAYLESIGKGN